MKSLSSGRTVAGAALVIGALTLGCGKESSPTEPPAAQPTPFATLPLLTVSVLSQSLPDAPSGTVRLKMNACSCLAAPIDVAVNGQASQSISCDQTKDFSYGEAPITLTLTSPQYRMNVVVNGIPAPGSAGPAPAISLAIGCKS